MQQMLGVLCDNDVDGVKQPLEIAFRYERGPDVRHNEIANEHYALVWQVNEHGVVSLSSPYRDKFDACSSDLQFGVGSDGHVGFEATHILNIEAFTEKRFVENPRCIDCPSNFLLVVVAGIEEWARIQP